MKFSKQAPHDRHRNETASHMPLTAAVWVFGPVLMIVAKAAPLLALIGVVIVGLFALVPILLRREN
ncbi:hypothetical protein ACFFOS_27695 [Nocardioides kongjuensis]|uniref:Uncharacterized protein n=1 Tax=Nocardioides kongjuensis TaxID=349522 RepID=A0A852RCI9_9ACTN|nr:hypothetical protein [Nocardioides kongjuensis]NYD32713.1 hypothetical protein [Nocardioides kongjuensis]